MLIRANEALSNTASSYTRTAAELRARSQRQVRARRGLALFFPLLLALSTLFYWLIIVKHSTLAMSLFMWTPGTVALITRLILREHFPVATLRINRRLLVPLSVALLTPLAIGLLSYGFAWGTGITPLEHFHVSSTIATFLPLLGANPSLLALAAIPALVIGAELVGATGEELGWRSYMLPRLIDAGVPRPVLVSGIIWSLWHWPLLLLTPSISDTPSIVRAGIFLVTITSLGCISARLRLSTGSLWPSILLHAAWNGIILEIFDAFTKGADTSIWTGESGLLVAFVTLLLALLPTLISLPKGLRSACLAPRARSIPITSACLQQEFPPLHRFEA